MLTATSEEFYFVFAFPPAPHQACESSIIAKCAVVFWSPALRGTGLDFVKQLPCIAHFHSEQMSVQQRSCHICKPETSAKMSQAGSPENEEHSVTTSKPLVSISSFTDCTEVSAKDMAQTWISLHKHWLVSILESSARFAAATTHFLRDLFELALI